MANKKRTTSSSSESSSSTTTTVKVRSSSYIMNLASFVAVVICGVALFIAMILGKIGISASFVGMMQKVANIIGWSVLCFISFRHIIRRRSLVLWIVWGVAVAMIITGIILV